MPDNDDARPGEGPGAGPDHADDAPPAPAADGGSPDDTYQIDGKTYTKKDLVAIIGSRRNMDRELREAKRVLKERDEKDLDEKQKAELRAQEAEAEAADLRQRFITSEVQRALDTRLGPGKVSAKFIALKIENVDDVEAAVEEFINATPGLTQGKGSQHDDPPPRDQSPAGAPGRVDKEAILLQQINDAKTEADLEKAQKALDEYRGKRGTGAQRRI